DNQSDNSQKARMLAGGLYRASEPQLVADQQRAQRLLRRFNDLDGERIDEQHQVLRELLGSIGEGSVIKPTFACDYGYNIRVGRQSFINYHATFLDCARIDIGDFVQMGPGVQLYTAGH